MDPRTPAADDPAALLLAETIDGFRRQKALADRALAQVPDDAWHRALDPESNALSVIVRHVGGNLRSRWRDVRTTDGEKPDRDRDGEFAATDLGRDAILADWEAGWAVAFATFDTLTPGDLARRVTIRGEPHTLAQALVRSLDHTGQHVGQIVQLAKHHAGADWRTLSIPRNR